MDISTVIGLILGIGFVLWGILSSGDIINYIDIPSMLIVLGGTVGVTMIAYPMQKIKGIMKIFKKIFFYKETSANEVILQLINFAQIVRKDGALALEKIEEEINDEFLIKGIRLLVDGSKPEYIKEILETEINFLEERHEQAQGMLEAMGSYAPAFGMLGTLIGLVNMLQNLTDPSTIGPNMSVALITTLYGSFLANVIFLPMAQKLAVRSKSEILLKEIMIEGLLSIKNGENPRVTEEKLKTYINPNDRRNLRKENESEEKI